MIKPKIVKEECKNRINVIYEYIKTIQKAVENENYLLAQFDIKSIKKYVELVELDIIALGNHK